MPPGLIRAFLRMPFLIRRGSDMTSNSKSYYIYLVVLLGLAIRLLAWTNTQVVNPDGTLYIHQAKAIYQNVEVRPVS